MTEDDGRKPLLFENDIPLAVRGVFGLVGLFVIGIVVWELHPALWPLNAFTLFFLVIVCGALAVGGHMVLGSLFGWADVWTIRPGEMELVRRNPFATRAMVFRPADIAAIEVNEREDMDSDPFWSVEMQTVAGPRFRIYRSALKANAEGSHARIMGRFAGEG